MFCRSLSFLLYFFSLSIVLYVLLRYTDSDNPLASSNSSYQTFTNKPHCFCNYAQNCFLCISFHIVFVRSYVKCSITQNLSNMSLIFKDKRSRDFQRQTSRDFQIKVKHKNNINTNTKVKKDRTLKSRMNFTE